MDNQETDRPNFVNIVHPELIDNALRSKRIKAKDLAKQACISPAYMTLIRKGEKTNVRYSIILTIANNLGIDINNLTGSNTM